jgi:hypothetical protein
MTTKIKREKIRNVPSIEELREAGHKVRVYHCRVFAADGWLEHGGRDILMSKREMSERGDRKFHELSCKGGYTRIDLTTMTGQEFSAKFNTPKGHNFNRKRGIRACIGRIMKQWGEG